MKVDEFKDTLLRRSQETAKKALVAKPKPPVAVKNTATSTVGVLKEILDFLKSYKPGDTGAAKFVVTERDDNGKIKSFKVES